MDFRRVPKTPTNIAIRFTDPRTRLGTRLTHYGDAYLLQQFFQYLGLRRETSSCIPLPQRNTTYSAGELMIALVYPIIFGLGRIEATQFLKYNGLFAFLTGLPAHPNATTIRRFLNRLGEPAPAGLPRLVGLHDRYRQRLFNKPEPLSKFYCDCDTTVLTVAYNLLTWFKRLCLPDNYRRMTIESLRHRLLVVPARRRRGLSPRDTRTEILSTSS